MMSFIYLFIRDLRGFLTRVRDRSAPTADYAGYLIIAPRKFGVLKTNICPPLNVPPRTISKITLNYFQLF